MSSSLSSLIDCGTKLWLDSIDPDLVQSNFDLGATGATSNPIIVSDLIKTGRFDNLIEELASQYDDIGDLTWAVTDHLVSNAQTVFQSVWERTNGNDGYVSFELDPLLEDGALGPPHADRVAQYVELGKKWASGHTNRMIKVPATPAGLESLEALAAAGISLNVTLIFSEQQYREARDAVWRGAQQRSNGLDHFKSVYSIFVSRIDVYTQKHCPDLAEASQGLVGIVNAQRIWQLNHDFWSDKNCPLSQEIIFASTGTKNPSDPPSKYVDALAGSDIQTNPPATNDAVAATELVFERKVDRLPDDSILSDIEANVDFDHLEKTLMAEGLAKFADPQKALLDLVKDKRSSLMT